MIDVAMYLDKTFHIQLGPAEMDILQTYANRNEWSVTGAFKEAIQFVLADIGKEITEEEKEARLADNLPQNTIALHIVYPKTGPLSEFTPAQKGFLGRIVIDSLGAGVQIIQDTDLIERVFNVMERQGKGVRPGKCPVSEHTGGDSVGVDRSGPATTEGQVRAEGTGTDRLPDSD